MKLHLNNNSKLINIKSNINIGSPIKIEGDHGEPRKIISQLLKEQEKGIFLIGLIYVGRRLITKDNLELLKGRRHSKYYGLKLNNNRIYIKFGWHKIKNLTDNEMIDIKTQWHFDFFENEGKYLIEKSGGCLSPDNLIYSKTNTKV